MNKMVPTADFEREVATSVPVMSRSEKLLRWASLIRNTEYRPFHLLHRLEYYTPQQLASILCDPGTAFAVAASDPILRDAGLIGETVPPHVTVAEIMKFFELSQAELHEFSCNCGGAISNVDMANRIEKLAVGGPRTEAVPPAPTPSGFRPIFNFLSR